MEFESRELELVKQAIKARVTGCCEWDEKEGWRVLRDFPELSHHGLTLKGIKHLLIEHVENTDLLEQRKEERHPWREQYDF